MSWASFIKNEKVDTIRRTPPMPSNQFTFLAYSQLNANYHLLPNLYFVFDFFFFFLESIPVRHYFASPDPKNNIYPYSKFEE